MHHLLKKIDDDLLAEIKAVEHLNQVTSLRKRRERADKISRECTRRILHVIYDAKDSGLRITQISTATGYSPSYVKNLLSKRSSLVALANGERDNKPADDAQNQ